MSNASRQDRNNVAFDADRLTFAEAGSSQEAKRWADSTIRSRECRARKRMGLVRVRSVRPTQKQIQKLIGLGYLSLASKGDERAEGIAIEAYLADQPLTAPHQEYAGGDDPHCHAAAHNGPGNGGRAHMEDG